MFRFQSLPELPLRRGELTTLRRSRRGVCLLRVLSGRVWVTQSHDLTDHFLSAGQSLPLRPGAWVVVGAETDATLRIDDAATRTLQPLWHALRGCLPRRSAARTIVPATVAG